MENESTKRKGYELAGDISGKRLRTPENADDTEENQVQQEQEDNMMAWLTLDEETAAELSKLLETDEASPAPFKVRFMSGPYTSPVVFQCSSGYVTINGNEESCGSSFSELDSSVMASVDMGVGMERNVFSGWFSGGSGGAWGLHAEDACGLVEECTDVEGFLVKEMDGFDLFDCCDHQNDVDNDDDMVGKISR